MGQRVRVAAGKERGYKGEKYAVVGPNWKGERPAGITRIDSPTRWVEMQPRVRVKDQTDLPVAIKVMQAITVQRLSQYLGKPAPKPQPTTTSRPSSFPELPAANGNLLIRCSSGHYAQHR